MTSDEIKRIYTMTDILERYDLRPNRSGFIRCPFHKEKTASMKIYEDSFHCFGCGDSGDIFDFVQRMDNITFREAFSLLGGSYEHDFSAKLRVYHAQMERQTKRLRELERKKEMDLNYLLISVYRRFLDRYEPLTDEWVETYNALQYQLYKLEEFYKLNEMG